MKEKIWLSPPHLSGLELGYIQSALDSNWVAPEGPNIHLFEQKLESYLGDNSYCVALQSGTSAIHLALIMLGVKRGDEVLCQSFTFSASANPIVYQGAIPVFIDSEPDSWNMCPDLLEEAINDRISKGKTIKAIIVVHLYGMPAKMDEISAIALKYNIPVIEDAAEALGSTYKGRMCGTLGDLGILSFNGNKIITTSGGGALICKTKKEKEYSTFLSTQARDSAPHFQHSEIGYNYRMSNISAGIGCGQMEVLKDHITARRQLNQLYREFFSTLEGIQIFSEPDSNYYSNHWLTAIVIDEQKLGFSREDVRLHLEKENIESRPLWKPMHLQPVFSDAPYYVGQVAENLFIKGLCLPSGSNLSSDDFLRIKESFLSLF